MLAFFESLQSPAPRPRIALVDPWPAVVAGAPQPQFMRAGVEVMTPMGLTSQPPRLKLVPGALPTPRRWPEGGR